MISKWSNYLNERWRQRFGNTADATGSLGRSTAADRQPNSTGYPWLRGAPYPGYYSGDGAAGAIPGAHQSDVGLYSTKSTASG